MRAIVQRRYGGPEQWRLVEVPRPVAGAGQVLVRMAAASVHADVWHATAGVPWIARPLMGLTRPRHPIPGTDLAGTVAAVGPGVTSSRVGDLVFGQLARGANLWAHAGAFAEFALLDESRLAPVPPAVTLVEAASIPTAGLIAMANVGYARIEPGMRVLVNGAAGGVGLFVVQIARARGGLVTAVDSSDRLDLLAGLGFTDLIDYRTADYTAGPAGVYDAVIDIPGNRPLSRIARILRPHGRYVLIGHNAYGAHGRRVAGSLPTFAGLTARTPFSPHLRFDVGSGEDDWPRLVSWVADGSVRTVVDRIFPLEAAADALRYLMSGAPRGKVVVVA